MELDLRTLRHLVAIDRHRHYGRAAAALNLSQPALSRSIATAENTLGVRLFERDRRGVRPTAFGAVVLAHAEKLLGDAMHLREEIERMRGLETGMVRVGAGLYPAEISVGAAMGRLYAHYPGLRLELLSDQWRDVAVAVTEGQLDLAILELSPLEGVAGLDLEPLPSHPGLIVCRMGHPLLRSRHPPLEAILEYPLVGPRLPSRIGSHLARASRRPLVDELGDFVPTFHVETIAATKQILANCDAVALLPAPVVVVELAANSLCAVDYSAPWLHTHYGFVLPRNRPPTPPVTTLMADIRELEQEMRTRLASTFPRLPIYCP